MRPFLKILALSQSEALFLLNRMQTADPRDECEEGREYLQIYFQHALPSAELHSSGLTQMVTFLIARCSPSLLSHEKQ